VTRVVVVPPVPALLPEYAGQADPVAALRAACREAVAWLGPSVRVLADDEPGREVGESLLGLDALAGARDATDDGEPDLLVLANGSARRSEKAPGHLDERAFDWDRALGEALLTADSAALAALDPALGEELMAAGLGSLRALGGLGLRVTEVEVDYADDPYGVQYWVVRWTTADETEG
jgi:hypothetical protein